MTQTQKKERSKAYNDSLDIAALTREETLDPQELNLLKYSKMDSVDQGIPTGDLGNQRGGFHFELFGLNWYSTEHLYLCGEWSTDREQSKEIQEYIRKFPSGTYAKRCSKSKYGKLERADFRDFCHQWMLWCVWQKCRLNEKFATFLKSIPDDAVIVEAVKNDPRWAAEPDANGVCHGCNAMGKILTICRRHLIAGTEPPIDTKQLNDAKIYILGKRIQF